MQNVQIQTAIATFAKTNKVGKAKVQDFVTEILSYVPKVEKKQRASKLGSYQEKVLAYIREAGRPVSRAEITKADVLPSTSVGYATSTLEEAGVLVRVEGPKSEKRGRASYFYALSEKTSEEIAE